MEPDLLRLDVLPSPPDLVHLCDLVGERLRASLHLEPTAPKAAERKAKFLRKIGAEVELTETNAGIWWYKTKSK